MQRDASRVHCAEWAAQTGNGSSGFPGYGGIGFNNVGAANSYFNSTYGIRSEVGTQLYSMDVRSTEQVRQVVGSVDRVTDKTGAGLGMPFSDSAKKKILNDTAVPTARRAITESW